MKQWEVQMRNLISETNTVRQELEHLLAKLGIDREGIEELAFDLSEFYGACRKFIGKLEELRLDKEEDPSILEIDLMKLEVNLEDVQFHLKDLLGSLGTINRSLSDRE